jgi:membrane protein YfhO
MSPTAPPEVSHPGSASRARTTVTNASAIAILLGITLAFYHGLWLPGLVLIKRDAYGVFLPLKQHLIERLTAGELPQWFPYDALGRPFIGVAATGVFHPFTALYCFLSVPDAYRASTLLSCLLAALGAFLLGRVLRFSHTGALLTGIIFALSGYMVSLTDNIVYLYSICVLPLFCAALEKALVGTLAWTVGPAVVWASVFLNGDVQTGYYFGFIALLWTAVRMPKPRHAGMLRLACVGSLAGLLAGIQLGPAWAVFVDSERTQPALFQTQTVTWSTHPLRLVTMVAAPVGEQTDTVEMGRYFFGNANRGQWAESLYVGVPVAGLALLGCWRRRDLLALPLLGSLALLLALGRFGGLYELFSHVVPFWSVFRYPEKLMGVASFAIAMLAGAGLDALRAGKGCPTPWLVVAGLCGMAAVGLHTEAIGAWSATRFDAPAALASKVTGSAGRAFLFSTVTALGLWLAVLAAQRGWLRQAMFLLTVVTLIALDLWRANFDAYHLGPAETAAFTPPLAKVLQAREGRLEAGRFRIVTISSEGRFAFRLPEHVDRLLGPEGPGSVRRRQGLDLEHNALFHIESANHSLPGFNAALAILPRQPKGMETTARFNIKYFMGPRLHTRDPRLAGMLIAELLDYDLALFRNPVLPKPRVYLSLKPERVDSPVDPAALAARSDFLNGQVDVIETSAVTLPGPARAGTAVIERYAPEEVRVRVETPQPAVLILLDAFDQGWTATLESGLELPIMRANALVRAVVVPAGLHMVTFRYETPLLRVGAAASLAGTLLCLGMIVYGRWRRRAALTAP